MKPILSHLDGKKKLLVPAEVTDLTPKMQKGFITGITLLKINMEPKNHPIAKENHLPNFQFLVLCEFSRV